MVKKLALEIKKEMALMGIDPSLYTCRIMFKVEGLHYFKVYTKGNNKHGKFFVWRCELLEGRFESDFRESQELR